MVWHLFRCLLLLLLLRMGSSSPTFLSHAMPKRNGGATLCKAPRASARVTGGDEDANPDPKGKGKRKREVEESGPSRPASYRDTRQRQKKKRKKKANKLEMPPAEQRLLPYIRSPNVAVRERISRAFAHRLYLIEKKTIGNTDAPSACEFYVLGATGNVYTVTVETQPSCTCPDFARGNTCKHILFVMLRVLKLPETDPRVWQKALLSSELQDLLQLSSINEAVVASQLIRQRFKEITSESKGKLHDKIRQRELEGDCPICYERMASDEGKALETVVFCKNCGNNVHKDCFKRWCQSRGSSSVTCIYCRAPWHEDPKRKKLERDEIRRGGGYINLASYSEVHQNEDTSLEALYPESSSMWIRRAYR